jgi:hypothetical protein
VHPSRPYPDVAQLQQAYQSAKPDNPAVASGDLAKPVERSFVQSAADRGLHGA